jgi:hypothetical protein
VEFDDGSGPAVGDDQRESVLASGPLMDEMDVQAVDLGGEVVEAVQRGLPGAPVVLVGPVGGQLLGVVQRDALLPVLDTFRLRPSSSIQPGLEVVEVGVGDGNAEWIDRLVTGGSCRPSCQREVARSSAHVFGQGI